MARRPLRQRRLILRAKELMAQRDIKTAVALHALLRENGVDISHSQLTRILNNDAELLNVNVINGLLTVLRCDTSDLFGTQ